MRARICFAFGLAAVWSMLAQAQTSQTPYMPGGGNYPPFAPPAYSPYPYGGYNGASTPAEGYARGIGEIIRAQGEYNLSTSAAAVNLSVARRREIENDKLWVQTYFETREINRQARDAENKRERASPEDWIRFAQAGRPKLLSNSELDAVTGKIHWPLLLTAAEFNAQRAELEKLFADRAYHGMVTLEGLYKLNDLTDAMMSALKAQIRNVPAEQYLEARRFLDSLAYEGTQPAG
jgi:hypothetical protein